MALKIAGTLFVAVSFGAANLAFKYIDPKDYSKESHHHNLAMEKFAKEHEVWSRENILNQEKIKHLELEKHHANVDFNITNTNLAFLKRNEQVLLKKEPQLKHYCQPSKKLQNYQHAASGVMGFRAAYGATKLLDLLLKSKLSSCGSKTLLVCFPNKGC